MDVFTTFVQPLLTLLLIGGYLTSVTIGVLTILGYGFESCSAEYWILCSIILVSIFGWSETAYRLSNKEIYKILFGITLSLWLICNIMGWLMLFFIACDINFYNGLCVELSINTICTLVIGCYYLIRFLFNQYIPQEIPLERIITI